MAHPVQQFASVNFLLFLQFCDTMVM